MIENTLSKKNVLAFICIIAFGSLFLKLYTIDFSLPISGDNWIYILRAIAIGEGSYAEVPYKTSGWPIILSTFFTLINPDNYIDYVNISRYLSIGISTATIFPIYFLARHFFNEKYSLVSVFLFALQPQLNFNAGLAYSEPLFLFFFLFALVFLLKHHKEYFSYFGFLLIGLCIWARAQAVTLVPVFIIGYLIYHRNTKNLIKKFFVSVSTLLLVVSPILIIRFEQYANPFYYGGLDKSLTGYLFQGAEFQDLIFVSLSNTINTIGLISIPYLIILFPIGMFFSFRLSGKEREKYVFIWVLLISSIIITAALLIWLNAARHMFSIYPFLIIFGTLGLKTIFEKMSPNIKNKKTQNTIIMIVMCVFVIASVLITYGIDDYGYGKPDRIMTNEIREYGKFLLDNADGMLYWSKGVDSDWMAVTLLQETDTSLKEYNMNQNFDYTFKTLKQFNESGLDICGRLSCFGYIPTSLENLITEGERIDLKYISISEKNQDVFLDDIYFNEVGYPFLIKIFDSEKMKLQNFKIKTFIIDYEKFKESKILLKNKIKDT